MAAVMALTAIASTRVAQAQEPLVVNIPFDFVAGNSQLPAGEYTVKVSAPTHSLILISRKDATASAFINTNAAVSAEPQSESKLIFNRYGDRYFLAQVWQQGYAQGRQLLKSSREKEVALSANIQTQSRVTLVAGLATTTR
jgi:malonyl CoA-acyl carrier protein transacylase